MPHIIPHTQETKDKISKAKKEWWKNHPATEEYRRKQGKIWLGRHHTEETKAKMRQSAQKADLVDKRFGRLLVLSMQDKTMRGQTVWLCKCDCGNKIFVSIGSLISNNTRSCGCLKTETVIISGKRNTIGFGRAAENRLFYTYKRQAKRRNLSWELSQEEFLSLTKKDCYYCRKSPSMIMGHTHFNGSITYNGIDRLDNKIGYIKENCVPCCNQCNFTKRNTDYIEFIELIRKIYKNLHLEQI